MLDILKFVVTLAVGLPLAALAERYAGRTKP